MSCWLRRLVGFFGRNGAISLGRYVITILTVFMTMLTNTMNICMIMLTDHRMSWMSRSTRPMMTFDSLLKKMSIPNLAPMFFIAISNPWSLVFHEHDE